MPMSLAFEISRIYFNTFTLKTAYIQKVERKTAKL